MIPKYTFRIEYRNSQWEVMVDKKKLGGHDRWFDYFKTTEELTNYLNSFEIIDGAR